MRRYYTGEKKGRKFYENAIKSYAEDLKKARKYRRWADCRYINNVIEAIRYGFYNTNIISSHYIGGKYRAALPRMKEFYLFKNENYTIEDETKKIKNVPKKTILVNEEVIL